MEFIINLIGLRPPTGPIATNEIHGQFMTWSGSCLRGDWHKTMGAFCTVLFETPDYLSCTSNRFITELRKKKKNRTKIVIRTQHIPIFNWDLKVIVKNIVYTG